MPITDGIPGRPAPFREPSAIQHKIPHDLDYVDRNMPRNFLCDLLFFLIYNAHTALFAACNGCLMLHGVAYSFAVVEWQLIYRLT